MSKGKIVSIYISPERGKPMQSTNEIHAVPGKGLEGDRYFNQTGKSDNGWQVTLMEIEVIEAIEREQGLILEPSDVRRNLVTSGVTLNNLVGKKFKVGEVTLAGIKICEPCNYLANMTTAKILKALVHRGGLRAEIISEGLIRVGDIVEEV